MERNEKDNSFVAEISPKKYGFEIKDGEILFNHYDWQDGFGQNITFDPATHTPIWNTRAYALRAKSSKAKKIDDNSVRFQNATKTPPPLGAIIVTYGNVLSNRLAQAIHIANSSNVKLKKNKGLSE